MKVAILVATVVGFMHVLPPSVAKSQEPIGRSLGTESNKFELTGQISGVTEPIGLSNYKTIDLNNRPIFSKAKFSVQRNEDLSVKLISL